MKKNHYTQIIISSFTIFITIIIIYVSDISLSEGLDIKSQDVDPQLLCITASSYYEKKYNIPKDILRSISIVESGRWNSEYKVSLAWPWVIGIDGKGKFFDSYAEAAVFLRKAVAAGQNVDIGCHQVNWKHHGHNFNKPEELLHPKHNAAYAAHFLVQKFNHSKSWNKAIAHYHSHTPEFGNQYLKKVSSILENMKGQNSLKYASYIQNNTAKIRKNKSIMLYDKQLHSNNSMKKINFQEEKSRTLNTKIAKSREIIVFSQNVELPINSAIVDY
jgi:hypothetical protein